jgi:exodeoxyribonuclease-5
VNENGEMSEFRRRIGAFFGMEPTPDQEVLFAQLEAFMRLQHPYPLFVLRGYAGTGKTSVLGAFVKTLAHFKLKSKLLAPTGRAAKVFAAKSQKDALTIHKQIYRRKEGGDDYSKMELSPNLHRNTTFIVDEASMIGDHSLLSDGTIGARDLLDDLFEYVYSGAGCRLIVLGDVGQLPPVGSDQSPALDMKYLQQNYPRLSISDHSLTKVLRQEQASSILENATMLRGVSEGKPRFECVRGGDLIRLPGDELQDQLERSYDDAGAEETIIITRSNKRANLYNNQIRSRILWYEDQLCSGDSLMAVKNNYFWVDEQSSMGFIANGEMMKVVRVRGYETMYGFEFAKIIVRFTDFSAIDEKELLVLTETLQTEGPSLSRTRMKELFFAVEQDYMHEKNKRKRYQLILKDPYFNALQVKYAYAVTCHKSQGGQWAHVFIDQGYVDEESINTEYYRWLYTALTRASEKAFLVNFPDDYFA